MNKSVAAGMIGPPGSTKRAARADAHDLDQQVDDSRAEVTAAERKR